MISLAMNVVSRDQTGSTAMNDAGVLQMVSSTETFGRLSAISSAAALCDGCLLSYRHIVP
jgi:hypothetical protein